MALTNGINGVNGRHSSPSSAIESSSTRPLTLQHVASSARVSFPVSSSHADWTAAEVSREAFGDYLHSQLESPLLTLFAADEAAAEEDVDEAKKSVAELQKEKEASILLLAHYLEFSASRLSPTDKALTLSALKGFHHQVLQDDSVDPHSAARELTSSEEARKLVVRAYFVARIALEESKTEGVPAAVVGKLWQQSEAKKVVGVFGGQGVNETYWDELSSLYSLYPTLLRPFLEAVSPHLTKLARAEEAQSSRLYNEHGLHVLRWLENPSTKPPVAYLATCAVSLPLIGLVQIAHYVTLGRAQALSPNAMSSSLSGGLTGHSQGIVIAALVAGQLPASSDAWPTFYDSACHALTVLFHIGMRGSIAFPTAALPPSVVAATAESEGFPTPMLAVTGLPLAPLEKKIAEVDKHLRASAAGAGLQNAKGREAGEVQVSLFNGPKAFVVTGHPKSLVGLVNALRKGKAESGKDQSKIPYSKRLPVFSMRFLPIGVPYHSRYLAGCTSLLMRPTSEGGLAGAEEQWWDAHQRSMTVPVYNTETGEDLRQAEGKGLMQSLADQIFTSPIRWVKACTFPEDTTHTVDFGLGSLSGIGSLVARNVEGKGNRVVFAGLPVAGQGGKAMNEVYDSRKLVREEKWTKKFQNTLVKTRDGKIHLDTPFSRLLSKPPLMVAGMTPCTVSADFNAAVMNAGYHIELAGGGHYNPKALRTKVAAIRSQLNKPGLGLTLNALYINQRQWGFQFPLWLEMRKEGLPIEGFCVAAGIPSVEKAKEVIDGLRDAGIKHVSFKPGSVDGIRQVVNIATANPDFPVILQWTGGRAGGHHSCEDFHQPILSTYASIRAQPNLILVGGSGFGAADDVYPYLTGEWSREFGVEAMPFDGFLFASRMMVAKEAATSASVKQLIVDAKGVSDAQWEGTYDKETGGIITVTSELGEPIHKIATRGIKLWKEFDQTVFALPREKRAAWLEQHRDYVIKRLNADFQKPWFAEKDGAPAELGDMTYEETVNRLVRLMFVKHQSRWIDPSLRNLVGDWIRRIEERLSVVNGSPKVSELQSFTELNDPAPFLERFFSRYPDAKTQILASEDVAYFLALSQRPGQKPVPFIPVLNSDFGIWFKKDSLWQAEDTDAVFDQDPQRVAILQGPVAVAHSTKVDEPAGKILGGIEDGLIKRLVDDLYDGDESRIPVADYIGAKPTPVSLSTLDKAHIAYKVEDRDDGAKVHTYDINGVLPPHGDWLDTIAGGPTGPQAHWLRAFLASVSFVHGQSYVDNVASKVLTPRNNQRVQVTVDAEGRPKGVKVYGAIRKADLRA